MSKDFWIVVRDGDHNMVGSGWCSSRQGELILELLRQSSCNQEDHSDFSRRHDENVLAGKREDRKVLGPGGDPIDVTTIERISQELPELASEEKEALNIKKDSYL